MDVLNGIIATIKGMIPADVMAQIQPIIDQITNFIAGLFS